MPVNSTDTLSHVLGRHFPWCNMWEPELKELFRLYVDRKQDRNLFDYDDLLLYWEQLVSTDEMAAELCGRFDHVLGQGGGDHVQLRPGGGPR